MCAIGFRIPMSKDILQKFTLVSKCDCKLAKDGRFLRVDMT